MSMKIKNLNLNSLIEYENNPRDNDAEIGRASCRERV